MKDRKKPMSIRMWESIRLRMKKLSEKTDISLERLWADAAVQFLEGKENSK